MVYLNNLSKWLKRTKHSANITVKYINGALRDARYRIIRWIRTGVKCLYIFKYNIIQLLIVILKYNHDSAMSLQYFNDKFNHTI